MRTRAIYTSLRRRADFTRVHAQGRRKGDTLLQVRVLPRPASARRDAPLRVGMIVSKKFGPAVARNRFKRLVRAALRAVGPEVASGWDILVLPRDARQATMPQVRESLRTLLGALGVLLPRTDTEGDAV